eukprot:2111954-Rhodomonas_salina.3
MPRAWTGKEVPRKQCVTEHKLEKSVRWRSLCVLRIRYALSGTGIGREAVRGWELISPQSAGY